MSVELTEIQQNTGDIYSFLWTYYTLQAFSIPFIKQYKSLRVEIISIVFPNGKFEHGYECHTATVTGMCCEALIICVS